MAQQRIIFVNADADIEELDGLVAEDSTGLLSYDSHPSFSNETELVDKKYVDDSVAATGTAAEWQDSALDILLTPPASPSSGDRYLITGGTATGDWNGHDEEIAEWDGSAWQFTDPTTGTYISVDDETDGLYYFNGTAWTKHVYESTTASLGVEKVGVDIRLDLLSAGGLKLTGNEVGIEPDDFAGEGLIDDGSDNLAIDWSTTFNDAKAIKASDMSSTSNGLGASIIGIEDAGSYTTETDVEGAIQEIYSLMDSTVGGAIYTAGAGGINKGDLVYVSSANTVSQIPVDSAHVAIGVAEDNVAAGADVKVSANDSIISGILTSATPGQKVFWNGTGWNTSMTGASGHYVWLGGVAKNATDLHVEVAFVKRNR